VVGIATRYGLEGLGIESSLGRDFPHLCTSALEPTKWFIELLLLLLLLLLFVTTFTQDIYNYVRGTNHVSRVYNVAAIL
jgi:hypothetical protein